MSFYFKSVMDTARIYTIEHQFETLGLVMKNGLLMTMENDQYSA